MTSRRRAFCKGLVQRDPAHVSMKSAYDTSKRYRAVWQHAWWDSNGSLVTIKKSNLEEETK